MLVNQVHSTTETIVIRRLRLLGILPMVGYLAACGDSGGATGDTLTASEVGAIADMLFGLNILVPSAPPVMLAAAAEPVQQTVPCAAGGSLSYSGDATLTEGNESFDLTLSTTHARRSRKRYSRNFLTAWSH